MAIQPGTGRPFEVEEVRVEELGLIAVAVIAEDRHHRMARAEVPGEVDRAGNVDRRRAAEAEALILDEVEEIGKRFGIRDPIGIIRRETLEIGGDAALADALGDRGSLGFQLAVLCRIHRVRRHRDRRCRS